MISLKHDSHDELYKKPFGAVKAGEKVKFSLSVENGADDVLLRLWNGSECMIKMHYEKTDGNRTIYSVEVAMPDTPCLVWYYFIADINSRRVYYGNNEKQLGGVGKIYDYPPPSYQITVYKAQSMPPWLYGGMIYQIFPDRFYNPYDKPLALKADSLWHDDWNRAPLYARDRSTGEILAYDFFGGNLDGITAKLDYLKDFGVRLIYLNPVFLSVSNHRFDTGDYEKIDPVLGDETSFRQLCKEAEKRGMYIILDGVFSHTGSDSRYFNKEGTYSDTGAYQSIDSPYYSWFKFKTYPREYESWWGIGNLPNVDELNESYLEYMVEGPRSIARRWIKAGAKGWRLDVADELPEEFIKKLRNCIKEEDPESFLLGEVWEDASHKTAYDSLRCYFLGDQLDSVMNYPFKDAVHDFLLGRKSSGQVLAELYSLYENYPPENFNLLMNLLGTHDAPRILTSLAGVDGNILTDAQKRKYLLSYDQRESVCRKLWMALVWQMTFAGLPSVYYADEAGAQGFADPFNRGTYPWGREDSLIYKYYWRLSRLRRRYELFARGAWSPVLSDPDILSYKRALVDSKDEAVIIINRKDKADRFYTGSEKALADILSGEVFYPSEGHLSVPMEAESARILHDRVIYPDKLRKAGILLHPSSLPSDFGIGDMGPACYKFLDFLAESEHFIWQILPLGPVDEFGSPYAGCSAYAGNTLLLSPELMAKEGYLSEDDLQAAKEDANEKGKVDFAKVRERKNKLFKNACKKFKNDGHYEAYCRENAFWLDDYALYQAVKDCFFGKPWHEWPEDIKNRKKEAVLLWQEKLSGEISYHKFLQYEFWRQWSLVRTAANKKGITIMGDVPIYLAADSVDVWVNRSLFELLPDGRPAAVAGVPPDYFSHTGQLWGNPLYRWDECKKEDYAWWKKRLEQALKAANIVRLDHFRGFEAYWRVDSSEKTAQNGTWEKGPGEDFFLSMIEHFGTLPFIAEDLGIITDEVRRLRDRFDLPGMDVLQFGLSKDHTKILYTGTHDNDTLCGWLSSMRKEETFYEAAEMVGIPVTLSHGKTMDAFLQFVYTSDYTWIIVPMQDVLGLPSKARINTPSSMGGNWSWRLMPHTVNEKIKARLQKLADIGNRKKAQNIDEIIPGMW